MSKEYNVDLHFIDGKTVTVVFCVADKDDALKNAFGGKLNCTHIIVKVADSEDKIGYSVSALAWAEVKE